MKSVSLFVASLLCAAPAVALTPLPVPPSANAANPVNSVKEVAPMPPVAKKVPKAFDNFGEKRVDDYYWLREKTNPETIAYLNA